MNLETLNELVAAGESEHLEFKLTTGQRTDAAKAACAMLNGAGGFLGHWFAEADAMQHLAGHNVERSGQIVLFIRAWRHDSLLSTFLHPLIADLRQEVDVEFVSKQQELLCAEMLENPANSCQFFDPLRVIIFGNELGTFPGPTELMQPTAGSISRDLKAAIDFELGGERGTTPAGSTPTISRRRDFEQSQRRRIYRANSCREAPEPATAIQIDREGKGVG